MLIPKKMFRALDVNENRGNLFVLAHKHGPDGKIVWRPDSEELPASEEYLNDVEKWEESSVAQSVRRYNEIPIEEGTEQINVVQVGINASPSIKVGGK